MTPDEAAQFCHRRKENYIGKLLSEIDKVVPRCNFPKGNNPNHNTTHHHYQIGREHTRVIYVEVVRAYLDSDETVKQIRHNIIKLAKEWGAEEIDDHGKRDELFIRIWWD